MEIKKLLQEELQEISQIRAEYTNLYANLGLIQVKIKELEGESLSYYQGLEQLKEKETLVFEKLKQTYGNGTIDLETGEFKPTIE
jgi:predicted nuclease with TOPRIM domain